MKIDDIIMGIFYTIYPRRYRVVFVETPNKIWQMIPSRKLKIVVSSAGIPVKKDRKKARTMVSV